MYPYILFCFISKNLFYFQNFDLQNIGAVGVVQINPASRCNASLKAFTRAAYAFGTGFR